MYETKAYSATSQTSPLAITRIPRRDPTDRDVQIEILFCGICHSDLHAVRDEWSEFMPTVYPIVPGHEIVGRVTDAGSSVTKYKRGDLVGVGCLVDADLTCNHCKANYEQFYWQCVSLLLFTGRKRWHFCTFDPRFKNEKYRLTHLIFEAEKLEAEFDLIVKAIENAVKQKLARINGFERT